MIKVENLKTYIPVIKEYCMKYDAKRDFDLRKEVCGLEIPAEVEHLIFLAFSVLNAEGNVDLIERVMKIENPDIFFGRFDFALFFPECCTDNADRESAKVAANLYHKAKTPLYRFAQLWAFYSTPFLKTILDAATEDFYENDYYWDHAESIKADFLRDVKDGIQTAARELFEYHLLFYITEDSRYDTTLLDFDISEIGFKQMGHEANIWSEFSHSDFLKDVLKYEYEDFISEIVDDIIGGF